MHLEILICTHNRSGLLAGTLASLNRCTRPDDGDVEILVVANACSDDTHDFLEDYRRRQTGNRWLPLRWSAEAKPGKSHALNHGISLVSAPLVAITDDDQRAHPGYLTAMLAAAKAYPDATMFCGRLLPDWDGWEPAWAHDVGPFAIYPLPVPHYDLGSDTRPVGLQGPLPGGGNVCLRRQVLDRVGLYDADLGPHGHDLGGGEDTDFMDRALRQGECLRYVPDMVQYHLVEGERLRLRYLMLKSFQRTRSATQVRHADGRRPPRYLWRKLATYIWYVMSSLHWPETRFYLIRTAAAMGEISAYLNTSKAK